MGFANENKIEVLLLQDFYSQDGKVFAVPSSRWQVFVSKKLTAAVLVTRGDLQVVHSYSDDNSVFVNITTTTSLVTVGSIYSKPKGNLLQDMAWMDFFSPLKRIIVGADLNARLALLGYLREDERGHLLDYLILSKNLTLINDIEAPSTFVGEIDRPCSGTPDVTLCTQDIAETVSSWFVDDITPSESDHRYIRFSITLKPHLLTLNRFKTKYTNFKKFNNYLKKEEETLQTTLNNIHTRKDLDTWLENFNKTLKEICQKTLKIKKIKTIP